MKKTRFIPLLLAFIVLVTFTLNPASKIEAATVPTFSVEKIEGAAAGDEVEVAISVSNNPGIVAATLKVTYDSKLTCINVEDTGILNGYAQAGTYTSPFNLFWEDGLSQDNNTANGVIAKLTFKVADDVANGTYGISITYDPDEVYDVNMDSVAFEISEGGIVVSGAEPTATPSPTATPNPTATP